MLLVAVIAGGAVALDAGAWAGLLSAGVIAASLVGLLGAVVGGRVRP